MTMQLNPLFRGVLRLSVLRSDCQEKKAAAKPERAVLLHKTR